MPKPPGRLSKTFANSRDIQKIIQDDYVLGYVVIGASKAGSAKVWPLYRGDVHVKTRTRSGKTVHHVFSTYEQGETLNGHHFEDPVGAQLAMIASSAISALEEMKRGRDYAKRKAKRKR